MAGWFNPTFGSSFAGRDPETQVIYQLLCSDLLCPNLTRQIPCPTLLIRFQSLRRSSHRYPPFLSTPPSSFVTNNLYLPPPMLTTLSHSPSSLRALQITPSDDAPDVFLPRPYLDLSPTSSGSSDHDSGSSQSSLPKAFHEAFFTTRSRVLKVSGVFGITSLTPLT